jgi:type II restriction/modification system DNA methylase subunit YeeA
MGDTKGGAFDTDAATAQRLIMSPNPDGRSNADVVRPWVNGDDLTGRRRGQWIIDFGPFRTESDAALYEAPFELVRARVHAARQLVRRAKYAAEWWLHVEPRPGLRAALAGLDRYIATPRVAKHRLFVWLNAETLPDSRLIVFARDDDYTFGVLHSSPHELWSLAQGARHETRPTYNSGRCFETFPFPVPSDLQRGAIAASARALVQLRDGWLNPPGLTVAELAVRTLTNLYNQRPSWLSNAHSDLDRAVLAAYGWPADLANPEILERLLALNLEREPA